MSSVRDAAFRLVRAYPGGATALGPRLGKRGDSLAHEVAGRGFAKLGLEDAVAITVMSGDLGILNAFAAECDCHVLPLPELVSEVDELDSVRRMGALAKEFSELLGAVADGLADGRISHNEFKRIQKEWGELEAVGQRLLAQITAAHERGIPKHERDGKAWR